MSFTPVSNFRLNPFSGQDYSRLNSQLNQSDLVKKNNALFQTVSQLIKGVKTFQDFVNASFGQINTSNAAFETSIGFIGNSVNSITNTLAQIVEHLSIIDIAILDLEDRSINLLEVDTSASPVSLALEDIVLGFMIIKDVNGNASVNNITLTGDVDGVTDPVINNDYETFRVYKNADGDFHEW
jgi:hypothetical protein